MDSHLPLCRPQISSSFVSFVPIRLTPLTIPRILPIARQNHHTNLRSLGCRTLAPSARRPQITAVEDKDDGIAGEDVRILAKFKSRHNYIRVLEVSRELEHPFSGSRLLLLDHPGNIHSINFLFKLLTGTYFDVLATFPPILNDGPLGILGFGAGTAATIILQLYPQAEIHGYEIDPCVVSVGREYFGLAKVEKKHKGRIFIYVGDALKASVRDGFAGIIVDLFSKGTVIPELQRSDTWWKLRRNLREGGRIMVNCGGSCVEPEDGARDGRLIMEETLRAMNEVFEGELYLLNLGNGKDDSCIAVTGRLPDPVRWKEALPTSLRHYVDAWKPYQGER